MRAAAAALLLLTLAPVQASHDWFGLDLCVVGKETMPPELDPSVLPELGSEETMLLRRFCGQCHHAPGPGIHTVAEWPQVLRRMRTLMEVTARFGGLVRDVRVPTAEEQAQLSAYLLEHALKPLPDVDADRVPAGYRSLCGDCHAAPDPAIHGPQEWPAVLARMEGHRAHMGRSPADLSSAVLVGQFLTGDMTSPIGADEDLTSAPPESYTSPWFALGPFFTLVLLGGLRWYVAHRRGA